MSCPARSDSVMGFDAMLKSLLQEPLRSNLYKWSTAAQQLKIQWRTKGTTVGGFHA